LLEKKHKVFGIDIRKNAYSKLVDLNTIHVDLRSVKNVKRLPRNIDFVIHLAAHSRVMQTIQKPSLAAENLVMTTNVLDYCVKTGVKGLIFSSSREVYGNVKRFSCSEQHSGAMIENPYGASKLACEALIQAYAICFGLRYDILRFSNVYGMYDQSERVIPFFIRQIQARKPITIYGKDKTLDFTHIDDVVHGIMLTIQKFRKISNMTMNIASGKGVKLASVVLQLGKHLGEKPVFRIRKNRAGEVMRFVANISLAKRKLGYHPKKTFSSGIAKAVQWHQQQKTTH
jgi:UDP-glucose 4-epimerase